MIDLTAVSQTARIIVDESGTAFVQIPLTVWEKIMAHISSDKPSQHERIKTLLAEWEANPDNTSNEWWDEFQAFLRENRFTLERPETSASSE